MRPSRLAFLPLLAVAACAPEGAPKGPVGGTIVIGAAADANSMVPHLDLAFPGRIVSELLFERLAELGPSLDVARDSAFAPRLADRWSWSADSLVITFHLNPRATWHDGQPLVAADVRAGFAAIRDTLNGSPLIANVRGIDSVHVVDAATVSVHYATRDPEQFSNAMHIFPLPAHLVDTIPPGALRGSAFAKAPVGSGRFRFISREPGQRIELRASEDHYRGRARLDRVVLSAAPDPRAGLARLWAGETDVWEPLTPPDLPEAAKYPEVRVVSGLGYDYGFMQFNTRDPKAPAREHPLLAERQMRRALTMAIDRDALRRALLDTLALVSYGPFTRPQPTADTTIRQIPFDRTAAAKMLDSLGWIMLGNEGVRRKRGARLTFDLIVPTSSAVRRRAAVLIQEQLKQVGAEVTIREMEFNTFRAEQSAGKFDLTLGGWRTTPSPGGIRGTWGSDAINGGAGQNAGKYTNTEFDAAVQAGLSSLDPARRKNELRRAYQLIVDDAAAVWLYEIKNFAGLHRRLTVPAWRTDAWWLTIAEWTVDPDQRLPRDARPE